MPKTYEEACRVITEKIANNVTFVAREFDGLPKNEETEKIILQFSADGIARFLTNGSVPYLLASYDAIFRVGVLIGLEMRRDESIDELIRSAGSFEEKQ